MKEDERRKPPTIRYYPPLDTPVVFPCEHWYLRDRCSSTANEKGTIERNETRHGKREESRSVASIEARNVR